MPRKRKRSVEPIGPTNIPGEPLDPKLDTEEVETEAASPVDDEHVESEEEEQARDSEKAIDRALNRLPPV